MPVVEACIERIKELTADIDLDAEDALARVNAAYTEANPEVCAFLEDGAESIGVSDEEVITALIEGLDFRLLMLLSTPSPAPFEYKVDEF
jgi:hypothetical protein